VVCGGIKTLIDFVVGGVTSRKDTPGELRVSLCGAVATMLGKHAQSKTHMYSYEGVDPKRAT
jgi:hypothetical protein